MKGFAGSALTLAGIAVLAVLSFLSFKEVADAHGGFDAFMADMASNPQNTMTLFWYEFAKGMVTPLFPIGMGLYVPLGNVSPLAIFTIAGLISIAAWKMSAGAWIWLIVPVAFLAVSTLWLTLWVNMTYTQGSLLGMTEYQIRNDIMASQEIFNVHPLIFFLSLFGAGFVLYRGKGAAGL